MSLIVEDGTGLTDADSYVSVADCATYAAAHGLTFSGEDPAKEAALRRATQYLDAEYVYRGERLTSTQALEWPRTVNLGAVPREIVAACCELACKSGDLWADVAAAAITERTVGPITTKFANPANGGQKRFGGVDAIVRRWLSGGNSTVKLVRA